MVEENGADVDLGPAPNKILNKIRKGTKSKKQNAGRKWIRNFTFS